MNPNNRVQSAGKLLRVSFGLVVLLAGLDKILGTNLLAEWSSYISPLAQSVLPFSATVFMGIVGVIEVAVAVLIFTKWAVPAFYIASAWLVLIALNLLILGGYVDVAVRDILLAIAAYATGQILSATSGEGQARAY